MRTKILSLVIFSCCTICSHAQVKKDSSKPKDAVIESKTVDPIVGSAGDEDNDDNNKIFVRVEQEAEFPGGDAAWGNYLRKNLDPDVPIRKNAKRGTYQVIIRFVVNKKGEISNVTAETSYGHGMEEEAIRVIKNGPKWMPAMQNGRAVNAYRRQPITFLIQ